MSLPRYMGEVQRPAFVPMRPPDRSQPAWAVFVPPLARADCGRSATGNCRTATKQRPRLRVVRLCLRGDATSRRSAHQVLAGVHVADGLAAGIIGLVPAEP